MKVVSVINPMIYSLEEIGFFRGKRTDWAHRAIGETLNVLRSMPFKISAEVIAGRTVQGIIDRAKNWHADLMVLGTHQRLGLKRLLWGNTSAAVANRAHCSVRVIHGRRVSHSESLDRSERSKKIQLISYKSLGLRKAA